MRSLQYFQPFHACQNPPPPPSDSNGTEFWCVTQRHHPICRIRREENHTSSYTRYATRITILRLSKIIKATSSASSRARSRSFCLLGRHTPLHIQSTCQPGLANFFGHSAIRTRHSAFRKLHRSDIIVAQRQGRIATAAPGKPPPNIHLPLPPPLRQAERDVGWTKMDALMPWGGCRCICLDRIV